MITDIIFNLPSHEAATASIENTKVSTRLPLTPLVREAIMQNALMPERYDIIGQHFAGGIVTGNKSADHYLLAQLLADWEVDNKRGTLAEALSTKKIKLRDIVKRIAPELKRAGINVKGGVIVGLVHNQES